MDTQQRPSTVIHLVGERFAAFAGNTGAETVNRFIGNVRSGLYDDLDAPVRLACGQGVDASDWEVVSSELSRRGLVEKFRLPNVPVMVPAEMAHKRCPENVMVADARRTGPMRLAARLALSDMNELVQDHVTGQHVAGMVLIEAARQLMQVTNHEFVVDTGDDTHSFVLCSLGASFEGYVFPLAVDMECTLTRLESSKPVRQDFTAEVVVSQNGEPRVRVRAEYQVVRSRALVRQEGRLAAAAVLAQSQPEPEPAAVASRVCASTVQLRPAAGRVPLNS